MGLIMIDPEMFLHLGDVMRQISTSQLEEKYLGARRECARNPNCTMDQLVSAAY
jgi:hypothetical protein